MIKIDLHTHSIASKDGGITPEQYADILKNEKLDIIAITDHDRIDFAQGLQKALGSDKIIVGEEISTAVGDVIGLYLTDIIEPGLSIKDTIDRVHAQGGIVYIPHPFESIRKGISREQLDSVSENVDIVEGFNGRAFFQHKSPEATAWARLNGKVVSASSDAHGKSGIGRTYSALQNTPTRATLVHELAISKMVVSRPTLTSVLTPKIYLLKNRLRGQK